MSSILPKNRVKAQSILADTHSMIVFSFFMLLRVCLYYCFYTLYLRQIRQCRFILSVVIGYLVLSPVAAIAVSSDNYSIAYATRMDAIAWSFEGSKFSCRMSHGINGFGEAIFEREAGVSTQFMLLSKSPRMKSGKADLFSQPPVWFNSVSPNKIAAVNVSHGEVPVNLSRKLSERMLAELEKGMDLHVIRKAWYGDPKSLKVVIPSVGFRKTYDDYLNCLAGLLPVNFSQVEKKSLYYDEGQEELTQRVMNYLDNVVLYIKEDATVKTVYIDGHTDSRGIRNDNLLKAKLRAEMVINYLVEKGIPEKMVVARWHGERYQVATNQTKAGRAKNRRVTIRLSKERPHQIMSVKEQQSSAPKS